MRTYLTLILMLSLLTSCGTASKNASPSPQSKHAPNTIHQQNQRLNQLSVKSNNKAEQDLSVKEHLETIAKRVRGVSNAHCVVMGNTVVVGIDVDGHLSRSRVGTIKYSVAEALRKDPRGMNAIVTADMDLSHRIAELGNHIKKGHPISGFSSELADIVGRIIPQLPKDVKPQQNNPSTKNLTTPTNKNR